MSGYGDAADHGVLAGLGDDDHTQYLNLARHSAVDHDNEIINHAGLEGVTADQHHAKSHAHNGADGSGTVAHSATTGQTTDDHHAQDHAARHRAGGADPLIQSAREEVTIGASSSSNITLTWPTAFPDMNYTSTAAVELAMDAAITAPSWYIRSRSASQIVVRVTNGSLASQTFHVHAMGLAD